MDHATAERIIEQRLQQRYTQRKKTLMRKIYEMCTIFNVDMYVVLAHRNETIAINSRPNHDWLPGDEELEREFGAVRRLSLPTLIEEITEEREDLDLPELPELQ